MIWRLEYCNKHGDTARLDIQRGDATPIEIVEGTENPFLLSYELEDKSKKGFIMSSFADISLYETPTLNIDELKTLDETELSVKWYINSNLSWSGFIVPDFFSREIGSVGVVNMAASDRLSSLKDATLSNLAEYVTLENLSIACLEKTGQTLPLNHFVDFVIAASPSINVMDVFALSERLRDDKGKNVSCYDILRSILVLTNSTIRQRNGQWTIYNKIQHEALTPSITFNEVYQGAKRTIQPVFSSVGAFQEFGGLITYPANHSFDDGITGWTAVNGFVTEFDNRQIKYDFGSNSMILGDETPDNQLINRNKEPNPVGSFPTRKLLSSPIINVDFAGQDKIDFDIEINTRGIYETVGIFYIEKKYDGGESVFLSDDGSWGKLSASINTRYETDTEFSDNIKTIKTSIVLDDGQEADKTTLQIHIGAVRKYGLIENLGIAIRSVKVKFQEKSDAKGILYRTEQIGNFSKKNDPETTIFGDHIRSGLNGYFYPYSVDDTSILSYEHPTLGFKYITREWTTSTDPTAGELPILQHVSRQVSRMFGVAHDILSAIIDARTFDPLHIISNCKGEKYVVVSSVYDFLRSTVEAELEQIAYGALGRRDFIYSYFGGDEDDGISSIGSVSSSGGTSGCGGGGSFLDKYFTYDETNDALIANVNLTSEKEIAAYMAGGQLPSIFDNLPVATENSLGVVKIGARLSIDVNGILSADIQDGGGGITVAVWADIAGRPVWLQYDSLAAFENGHGHDWSKIAGKPTEFAPAPHQQPWASLTGVPSTFAPSAHGHQWIEIAGIPDQYPPTPHGHTWSEISGKPSTYTPSAHTHSIANITSLQSALDGKAAAVHTHPYLGVSATAVDSSKLGGFNASDYARRNINETVTGGWTFNNSSGNYLKLRNSSWAIGNTTGFEIFNGSTELKPNATSRIVFKMTGDGRSGDDIIFQNQRYDSITPNTTAPQTTLTLNDKGNGIFTGQVGIGTPSPTETLDVNGSAKVTERFRLSDKWSIGYEGTDLFFYNSTGLKKAKIDQNGNLTMAGEVTAFGLI